MKRRNNFFSSVMRQHRIVFLVIICLMAFGVYGLTKMNKNEFPEFTIRQGVIVGVYPGATPQEIVDQLTTPLENYLFTFQEIDKEKTYSYSQDGMVFVFVELSTSVHNQNVAWSKIRHGLKDFKMMLPSGVIALVVNDDFGNTTSLLITMESDDKTYRELGGYMDELTKKLRTIRAIGNIKVFGTQSEEIQVKIEPEKLTSYGISSKTLLTNIYSQGFQTISGSIDNDKMSVPIHITSPYKTEKELEEQIVYSDGEANIIRLKDIATIERVYPGNGQKMRNNGRKALVLSIEMRSGNNIVEFGKDVDKVLEAFETTIPESVRLQRVTDQPKMVGDSVVSFLRDLLLAILIVIAVMLFLFPLRSALVAAASIPISIAVTWAVMYIFDIELNTVTLAVLIVVLGMVVDNSIVVIDGYIDYLRQGYSRWYAAVKSAQDYFPSLLLATVAICGMFYPILGIFTGAMADFVTLFPITMTISLMTSLAVSVTIVPFLEFRFIRPVNQKSKKSYMTKMQDKFFVILQSVYDRTLEKCFRHPKMTIGVGLLSIALAGLMFTVIPIQMMPKAERDCFAVEIFLPQGTSIQHTSAVSDSLRKLLENDNDIISITEFIGTSSPRFQATYAPKLPAPNFAQFIVKTRSNRATIDVLEKYSSKYENYFPEAVVRFKQIDYQAVNNPIEVRFIGNDIPTIKSEAEKLQTFMNTMNDQLSWIHSDYNGTMPYISVRLDSDEATRLGITKTALSTALATSFNGLPLTTIWEDDYPVSVKLVTDRNDSTVDFDDLRDEVVPTAIPNVWVPLQQIATISPQWQETQIVRRNGINCLTVGADLKFGESQPVAMKKIRRFIDDEIMPSLPDDVTIEYGGLTEVNDHTIPEVVSCIFAALTVILLFLLINFKQISITILSLSSCLLCLFGAFFGLWIFKQDLGLTSVLGIVSLIGIIVRNAIIMYEYAEELRRDRRMSPFDAALEAGKRRMRPIFLTSATTAVGVIPMIISQSTLWMPMGIVICFGTVFSIFLVVTILPILYWIVYKNSK